MTVVNTAPFPERHEIVKELTPILKTGDIIFRETDTRGPLNLPFSALVSRVSNSKFDHASIVIVEADDIYVIEVNERGVVKARLIDWLDYVYKNHLAVYRLKSDSEFLEPAFRAEINKLVAHDDVYNFTYDVNSTNTVYCTQSVCRIYEAISRPLMQPVAMKDVFKAKLNYSIFVIGNWVIKKYSGYGFDLTNGKYFFVGNETLGMLASPLIEQIYTKSW